ncbi:hypothetical protein AeNC1_017834, partial [Aphanomyces euteiches]
MGHPMTAASDVSSTQPSEAISLPRYAVDFRVKLKTGFLGRKAKYPRHQFVLTGQTLEVLYEGKTTHSFSACDVTIEPVSGLLYRLKGKLWQRLVFWCPSASRVERFRHAVHLAATTPHWSPPTYDVMTNLLHVATEIIETDATTAPSIIAISTVRVSQVQAHLAEMFAMYEFQGKCTSMVQVYSHLIDLEADYFADRSVNNFAHTVHRLHPLTYRYRDAPPYYYKINRKPAKEAFSKCPHPDCHHTLPIESMYKSHVKGETITCGQCGKKIPTPAFGIASFIKHTPQFSVQYEVKATMKTITVVTPPMPEDGNLKIFMAELQSRIKEQAPQASRKAMEDLKEQVRVKVLEHINPFKVISYDLDLVLAMIRQLDFVNKICAHMEYWNNPTVIQASI